MEFQFNFQFLLFEIGVGLQFVPIVLLLSMVPLIIGLFLGSIIAVIRLLKISPLDQILDSIVVFMRGVPIVLQLTILYLVITLSADSIAHSIGLPSGAKHIPYTGIALVGLSINATVYLSEIIRTALQSVNSGQYEAAYSVGMTSRQMLRRIVIPQALPVAIPMIGNNVIELIKNSSVASLISVMEILSATTYEANGNYQFFEAYIAAALVYWALCMTVEWIVFSLESHMNLSARESRSAI